MHEYVKDPHYTAGAVSLFHCITYQQRIIGTDNVDITAYKILNGIVFINSPAEYLLAFSVHPANQFRCDI